MKTVTLSKVPVDPQRVRTMPRQFAPLDRRLVYDKHTRAMGVEAIALYTFLECVSDPQGLSFYSEARICRELDIGPSSLGYAREKLIAGGFLLYRWPLYQLLNLPQPRQGR